MGLLECNSSNSNVMVNVLKLSAGLWILIYEHKQVELDVLCTNFSVQLGLDFFNSLLKEYLL